MVANDTGLSLSRHNTYVLGKRVGPEVGLKVGETVGRPVGPADGRGEVEGCEEVVGAAVGANSPYMISHKRQGSIKSDTESEG